MQFHKIGRASVQELGSHQCGPMRNLHCVVCHARGEAIDEAAYDRLFRKWFVLGWPAFGGLVVIFWLMVTKPTW